MPNSKLLMDNTGVQKSQIYSNKKSFPLIDFGRSWTTVLLAKPWVSPSSYLWQRVFEDCYNLLSVFVYVACFPDITPGQDSQGRIFGDSSGRFFRAGCSSCHINNRLMKYPVSKKRDTLLLPITLPVVNRFSKFFHRDSAVNLQ